MEIFCRRFNYRWQQLSFCLGTLYYEQIRRRGDRIGNQGSFYYIYEGHRSPSLHFSLIPHGTTTLILLSLYTFPIPQWSSSHSLSSLPLSSALCLWPPLSPKGPSRPSLPPPTCTLARPPGVSPKSLYRELDKLHYVFLAHT